MKRLLPVIMMNVLVPGTGLIMLGRQWLGLALSAWFGLSAEAAACGVLLAPASIPAVATFVACLLALLAWIVAQAFLVARIHFLQAPHWHGERTFLRETAQAISVGDPESALSALHAAISLDHTETALAGSAGPPADAARRPSASAPGLEASGQARASGTVCDRN